jgi:nucleoside phosphorylase
MHADTGSLGLVVALAAEAKALLGRHSRRCSGARPASGDDGQTRVFCLQSGPGLDRSGAAARQLLERGVDALACYGVSGALAPGMQPGEVVLAESVHVLDDGAGVKDWFPDRRWTGSVFRRLRRAGIPACLGPVCSTGDMVLSARRKEAIHRATGALAVDMESAAVVREATISGVPSLVIRSVCDPANDSLGDQMVDLLNRDGSVRWSALLLHLFRRPQLIGELWRMRQCFRSALSALRLAFRLQNSA